MNRIFYREIDDYLKGRLSVDEVDEFERAMSEDDELRRELHLSKDLMGVVLDEDCFELKQKLDRAKANVENKKRRARYRWLAAASFSLMFGLSFFLWHNGQQNPERLFDEYYQHFEVPTISRGGSDFKEFDELIAKYNSGDFTSAIPDLEKYVVNAPDNNILDLMLVSACLETKNPIKAELYINKKLQKPDLGIFSDTYHWYLCLAYLSQHKINKAISECINLEKTASSYSMLAKRLRADLEKLHN